MVNWQLLAYQLGCITEGHESYSSVAAKRAIAVLLSEEVLIDAVNYYISGGLGSELARGVLWQLQPWCAIEHCYKIFKQSNDNEERSNAIELLRVIADHRSIVWIEDFLADSNEGVQFWGIGLIEQKLFEGIFEYDEVKDILEKAKCHNNPKVTEKAHEITKQWEDS